MIYVYHITLSCHCTGRHTGLVSMTKAIHSHMLNKGHTHMIQINKEEWVGWLTDVVEVRLDEEMWQLYLLVRLMWWC